MNKKIVFFFLIVSVFFLALTKMDKLWFISVPYEVIRYSWKERFVCSLGNEEIKKMFPSQNGFHAEDFKAGSYEDRSSMLLDILEGKVFIGRNVLELREEIGSPDGTYVDSDNVLTYFINDPERGVENSYQLALYPDNEGRVSQVKVRKSDCP